MSERKIMAIGAHADDIEFDVGGSFLKYQKAGYGFDYIMSTNNMSGQIHQVNPDGSMTRLECVPGKMEEIRKREADAGAAMLGTRPLHLDYPQRHYSAPDGHRINADYGAPKPENCTCDRPFIMVAHECPAEVKRVADLILERDPEAVLSHGLVTDSPEHYATGILVTKAFLQARKRGYRGDLYYFFELCESSMFKREFFFWDSFIDITGFREKQFDLIRCHYSAVPFPERMDYFDLTPVCGCRDAELFNFFRPEGQQKPSARGKFTEELCRNYRPHRWYDPGAEN